jgi:hypothetical protein
LKLSLSPNELFLLLDDGRTGFPKISSSVIVFDKGEGMGLVFEIFKVEVASVNLWGENEKLERVRVTSLFGVFLRVIRKIWMFKST